MSKDFRLGIARQQDFHGPARVLAVIEHGMDLFGDRHFHPMPLRQP